MLRLVHLGDMRNNAGPPAFAIVAVGALVDHMLPFYHRTQQPQVVQVSYFIVNSINSSCVPLYFILSVSVSFGEGF